MKIPKCYKIVESSTKSQPPKYEVYGKIAFGETVVIATNDGRTSGEVCYVHPNGRYFQIITNGIRESFYFPVQEVKNGDGFKNHSPKRAI